jgi:hypothetical protein
MPRVRWCDDAASIAAIRLTCRLPKSRIDAPTLASKATVKTLFLLLALSLLSLACDAAELKTGSVVLLQPEVSMREKQPDVTAMAVYIKTASAAAADAVRNATLQKSSGFLLFAVREGGLSNAWVEMDPALPPGVEANIVTAMRRVPPFHIARGTLVFAVKTMINGAPEPVEHIRLPMAWKAAIAGKNESIETEALVGLVWPDHYIAEHAAGGGTMRRDEHAPEGHFNTYYPHGAKPDAYNSIINGQPSKLDLLAHQALDDRYHVIDIPEGSPRWNHNVRPIAGVTPPTPIVDGKPLNGYVMLAYVINSNGRAESPTIVQSTNRQLAQIAIAATNSYRFEPASIDGKIVWTVALQEFKF